MRKNVLFRYFQPAFLHTCIQNKIQKIVAREINKFFPRDSKTVLPYILMELLSILRGDQRSILVGLGIHIIITLHPVQLDRSVVLTRGARLAA